MSVFKLIFRNGAACLLVLLSALTSLSVQSCKESLPPRVPPPNPVEVSIFPNAPTLTIRYEYDVRTDSYYVAFDQPMLFFVEGVNRWDEVLQDAPDVYGKLEVWDLDRPWRRTTISLDGAYLISPKIDDGIVTLKPDDAAIVQVGWDNYSRDAFGKRSEGMWSGIAGSVEFHPGYTIFHTSPVHLALQATLQVFATTGRAVSTVTIIDVSYDIYTIFSP